MKRNPSSVFHLSVAIILFGTAASSRAALLSAGGYLQTFDGIEAALPDGWSARTGATALSLGTAQAWSGAKVSWSDTGGAFKNVASADGLTEFSTTAQTSSTDRAFGVRQIGTSGFDPGAAFVFTIDNTTGYGSFVVSFKAQMLSVQARSTTWNVQYQIGSGAFTTLGSYTDPSAWGSTLMNFNVGSAWNDLNQSVTIRIVALTASTGSGTRDTFAIDDFSLSYSAVPEPAHGGVLSACGLICVVALDKLRRRKLKEA
jgi:hypothetical protein